MPAFFFLLFQGNRIARFHGVYARTFMCALRILPLGGSGIWRITPRRPPSACGHIRPSRPAYPRHTHPITPLSVRPRKMPARPRGAQCGCARCRFVLSAWQPTFVHFQRLYPGSFIVHFGDIFVTTRCIVF